MRSNAGNISLTPYDKMFESTDLAKQQAGGEANSLPLNLLHPFKHHPFKLYNEEKMQEMVESIRQNGVLMPILVRPLEEGGFEIVSGHNRVEAAKQAGLTDIPANIREMDDETAIIVMVDSNLRQREKLLPSEKAFAYKMKLDAIRRRSGERTDLTSVQLGQRSDKQTSRDSISQNSEDSSTQIQRFIRLTNLVPPLIDMVDTNQLAFNPAVSISFLDVEQQFWLKELMERDECSPSLSQAERLKELSQKGTLDFSVMEVVMTEPKPQQNNLTLKGEKIQKYFPRDFTPQQMEEIILKLLETWNRRRQQEMEGR